MFYRLLLEISYRRQRSHFWARFLKKLIPVALLVFLIDANARHFRDMVGRLNAWWGTASTKMEMGEIAAAVDAEYASAERYPDPQAFGQFVRAWIRRKGRDPAYDRWGQPFRFQVDGTRYEILSCGPDAVCGTPDDIQRQGALGGIR